MSQRIVEQLGGDQTQASDLLRDLRDHRHFAFFTAGFLPQFAWWEACDMLRKLSFVGLALAFPSGSVGQAYFVGFLSVGWVALQCWLRPYRFFEGAHATAVSRNYSCTAPAHACRLELQRRDSHNTRLASADNVLKLYCDTIVLCAAMTALVQNQAESFERTSQIYSRTLLVVLVGLLPVACLTLGMKWLRLASRYRALTPRLAKLLRAMGGQVVPRDGDGRVIADMHYLNGVHTTEESKVLGRWVKGVEDSVVKWLGERSVFDVFVCSRVRKAWESERTAEASLDRNILIAARSTLLAAYGHVTAFFGQRGTSSDDVTHEISWGALMSSRSFVALVSPEAIEPIVRLSDQIAAGRPDAIDAVLVDWIIALELRRRNSIKAIVAVLAAPGGSEFQQPLKTAPLCRYSKALA